MQPDSLILPNADFWKVFKETPGALSTAEACAIINIASQAPEGTYICLGSHKGKDTLASSQVLKQGAYYLIDPIYENEQLRKSVEDLIFDNAKNDLAVIALNGYSYDFIEKFAPYSYVFLDSGSHGDGLPMAEVKLLEDRVISGGIIAFHDWNSQFKEVKEASDYLVGTGKYQYLEIDWAKIVEYVNLNNLEYGNTSWHHQELKNPCFVGAVKRL